jgi:multidrug efflux pump subunit AcrA (membrane-fusion protein)
LALDQASIDVALANLDNAQKSLAAANLVSTISGTVGAVTLTAGSSVSAGSTTATGQVVVLGSGASYQLVATVPVAKISQVAVGQPATVTPDSSGTVVNGTVTSIGVLATSGTTSTTYPVTVSFQSSSIGLYSGAEAELSIVTGRAVGVTTVPTSAVHTVGTNHLVTVVNGATTKQVRVSTGTVGTVLTQVTSGIKLGQRVSMADLNQPVPSSSTTSTRSGLAGLGGTSGLPGGSGGFGGAGGFSGGGFRGGAPGG